MRWSSMSQAERDAAYNNSTAVPDGPARVEALAAAKHGSGTFRGGLESFVLITLLSA